MSDDLSGTHSIDDWKAEVAKETGVAADVLRGDDLDEIREHAEQVQAMMRSMLPAGPAAGYVPSEGRTVGSPAPSPAAAFASFLDLQLGRTR